MWMEGPGVAQAFYMVSQRLRRLEHTFFVKHVNKQQFEACKAQPRDEGLVSFI